jgi:hypothetical protein
MNVTISGISQRSGKRKMTDEAKALHTVLLYCRQRYEALQRDKDVRSFVVSVIKVCAVCDRDKDVRSLRSV